MRGLQETGYECKTTILALIINSKQEMRRIHHTGKIVTAVFTTVLFCTALAAQDDPQAKLTGYARSVLQEKLYMHTDRSVYLAGDLLWFKLYNVDASLHRPLDMSKVSYVEILDASNTPAAQVKIGMQEGKGKGSIYLPVNIQSGHYKIRAYTNWMKNMGADYFFEKNITIVNTQKQREAAKIQKPAPPDIRFFPEGGNMVAGLTSRVALKATSSDGKGIACSGRIVDEQNNSVATFRTQALGMGSFYFTPQAAHTYKAVFDQPAGASAVTLPQVHREGYVMHVSDSTGKNIVVQLSHHNNTTETLYLLVHTRQLVKATMQVTIQNGKAAFEIDKQRLGDGISHITVFNAAKQPLCERLYFKYPENPLSISLATNSSQFGTRTKISFDINAAGKQGAQEEADMSMAVYQLDELQDLEESDINSFLLLSSDIKGTIESPARYFRNITPEVIKDMDNLMLTQGWRRFQWNDVMQNRIPAFRFVPEYKGHIVTGRILHSQTAQPVPGAETYVSAPGAGTAFMAAVSDSAGRLLYEIPNARGSSELIIQAMPGTDSLARIEINNPFFENYTTTALPSFNMPRTYEQVLLDRNLNTQVQNIYTGEQLKRFAVYTDTMAFYETPNNSYFLDSYTRFSTMEEVLREYVAYMDVRKRQGSFRLPLLDMNRKLFFDNDPLILVDGVPVFDADKLVGFDPLKMKKLEMVNNRYFLGNTSFAGIMNWHTYKGDLAGYELGPRATVIDYESLQSDKEFYMPIYDTPEKTASRIPDFRNLLYWSPDIVTAKGKKQVEIYTSDTKGKYIAIVQGITADGRSGTGMLQFEVK
jgi:hypothetical protein